MAWRYGDEIASRQVWRGRALISIPVRVVVDRDDLVVTYLAEGTPFEFLRPWPWGTHPWEHGRWQGHGLLALQRPGDAYAVWVFWRGPEREFAGWYVNLQQPFERTAASLDSFDHELDIWIDRDGSWQYKDEELLEECVAAGRFTTTEVAAIRSAARAVVADLEAGRRWWSDDWAAWRPDPQWQRRWSESG